MAATWQGSSPMSSNNNNQRLSTLTTAGRVLQQCRVDCTGSHTDIAHNRATDEYILDRELGTVLADIYAVCCAEEGWVGQLGFLDRPL